MIYDFYGFPKELYAIKYPAKGYVEVASKLQSMLRNYGIESRLDENRGLDSWCLGRTLSNVSKC
jgi:4,5-DOPA dioxygenase extradiol